METWRDEKGEITYTGGRGASVADSWLCCHESKCRKKNREINNRRKSRVGSPAFRSGNERKNTKREKEN